MRSLTTNELLKIAGGVATTPSDAPTLQGINVTGYYSGPPPGFSSWGGWDNAMYGGMSGGGGGGGGGVGGIGALPQAPDWQDVLNEATDVLTSLGFNLPAGWTVDYGEYFEFKNTATGQTRTSQSYNPGQDEIEQDGATYADAHQVVINDDSLSPYGADRSPEGDTFTIYVDSNGNPSTSGTEQQTITVPPLTQLEAAIVTLAHEYYHAAVDAEQGVPNPAWTQVEEERAQTQAYIALKGYEAANNLSH